MEQWVLKIDEIILTEENGIIARETFPSVTLPTTNLAWTSIGK